MTRWGQSDGGRIRRARRMLWLCAMRPLLAALLVVAVPALAADKPAALQLCLELPEDVPLFADGPAPHYRAVPGGAFVLDFDLWVNGHDVLKVTKSGPGCVRAWLPAEKVKEVSLDFSRLPLNLLPVKQPLSVQLKADLWSDGGQLAVTRAPWATASNTTKGALTLQWQGRTLEDWDRLPTGRYTLNYVPLPPPKGECPVTLHVRASGSVRPDRNPALYKELVDWYRREFLPEVIARNKLRCDPAEALQVTAKLVEGAWRDPQYPKLQVVRLPEKEPKYFVSVDGKAVPFVEGIQVELGPGQALTFFEELLQAER